MIFFKIIIANKSSLLTQTYTRTYMAIVLINKWFKQFKVIDRKTMGTYNNEILKKKKSHWSHMFQLMSQVLQIHFLYSSILLMYNMTRLKDI